MIVDIPDSSFRTVQWRLVTPQQINRSEWTGRRQVMRLPGASRWQVEAEHVPVIGEAAARPWRAFFGKLRGSVNTFRLRTARDTQHSGAEPIFDSINNANSVRLTGLTPNTVFLFAGQYMTIALPAGDEQLLLLTANVNVGGDGAAAATFEPSLRGTPVAGSTVRTQMPWATVALDESTVGWNIEPGLIFGFSISATEAF